MKNLLFIFIFFSTVFVSGQEEEFKKFHIGILFSPEYSYRTIKNVGYGDKSYYNDRTNPIFGFQTGILLDFKLKLWVSLETGFKLSKKGFETYYANEYLYQGKLTIGQNSLYQSFYIELPLKVNFYYFQTEKIKLYGSIAFTPSYLVQNKVRNEMLFEDGSTSILGSNKSDFIRDGNISGAVGLGIDYYPISSLGIRFEPFFNHSIISDYEISTYNGYGYSEVKYYHWSTGIRFAIFYVF